MAHDPYAIPGWGAPGKRWAEAGTQPARSRAEAKAIRRELEANLRNEPRAWLDNASAADVARKYEAGYRTAHAALKTVRAERKVSP